MWLAIILGLVACKPRVAPEKPWKPPGLVTPPREAMYQEMDEGNLDVADSILNDMWPARGFPDAQLPSVLTWTEDPYNDAYFRFMFYSLRHLEHLLFAYNKTDDRRYLDKLTSVLDSFVAYDAIRPYDREKLDDPHASAYRAMVLTNMFYKLTQMGELSPGLYQGIRDSLGRVCAFLAIEDNFEKWANHGFTEAAALLLVADNFPALPDAAFWRQTGMDRLEVMRATNVDADGVDIENSPFYHQYVLGMISQVAQWAIQYEPAVGETYLPTSKSMLKYLAYVAQPDGELPLLGASQETTIQSRDPKLFGPLANYDQEYAWAFSGGKGGTPIEKRVHLFSVSGLFALRAAGTDKRQTYVSFDAGAYRTNHSDLDALSVTIYSDGVNLCPDSGLFTYVFGADYDYFHGTRAHNTVLVDGRDQLEGAAFAGAYGVSGKMSWATATSTAYFGANHLRTVIILDQSLLLVADTLQSDSLHDYTQTWHLFPKARLSMAGLDANVTDDAGSPVLLMRQAQPDGLTVATSYGSTDRVQGWYSSLYNQKEPMHALEYTRHGSSTSFATLFAMGPRASSGKPTGLIESRDAATGDRLMFVCADGADATVRLSREGTSAASVAVAEGGGCLAVATNPGRPSDSTKADALGSEDGGADDAKKLAQGVDTNSPDVAPDAGSPDQLLDSAKAEGPGSVDSIAEGGPTLPRVVETDKVVLYNVFDKWTTHVSGGAAIDLAGGDGYNGSSSSATLKTDGARGTCYIESPSFAPVDMTGMRLRMAIKVADRSKLMSGNPWIDVLVGDHGLDNYNEFDWEDSWTPSIQPIVADGQWSEFSWPWPARYSHGAPERSAVTRVRFRVYDNNGGIGTTVQLGKVSIVPDRASLDPMGLATIWFDDGFASAYTTAYPILKALGLRASCAVITEAIGSPNYMSLSQLQDLAASGWDIVHHAPTSAMHASSLTAVDPEVLLNALVADRAWFSSHGLNNKYLAYPQGNWSIGGTTNARTVAMAAGFTAARTIWSENTDVFPPSDPFLLRAKTINGMSTSVTDIERLASALTSGPAMLGFVYHDIVAGVPSTENQINVDMFTQQVTMLHNSGVKILPISEILP
jgi:hypothetical protein